MILRNFFVLLLLSSCITPSPTVTPQREIEQMASDANVVGGGLCVVQGNSLGFQLDCKKDIASFRFMGATVGKEIKNISLKDGKDTTSIRLVDAREIEGNSTKTPLKFQVIFGDRREIEIVLDQSGKPVIAGSASGGKNAELVKQTFALEGEFYTKKFNDVSVSLTRAHVDDPSVSGFVKIAGNQPFRVDAKADFTRFGSGGNISLFPSTAKVGNSFEVQLAATVYGGLKTITYYLRVTNLVSLQGQDIVLTLEGAGNGPKKLANKISGRESLD